MGLIRALPSTDRLNIIRKVASDARAAQGHRHYAPSTMHAQDHHLGDYTEFLCMMQEAASGQQKRPTDFTVDQLEEMRFPRDNFEALYSQLRSFVVFVYKNANPASRSTGENTAYTTLASYRDSILFWLRRSHSQRRIPPPSGSHVFFQITEAIRLGAPAA